MNAGLTKIEGVVKDVEYRRHDEGEMLTKRCLTRFLKGKREKEKQR